MGKQRKTWSTDVKEAIVLSVLRGELGDKTRFWNSCTLSKIRRTRQSQRPRSR